LADFPNIEYIETQWPKKRWVYRLWYEYVTMKKISKAEHPVYLWFSLHDTSPSVLAQRRAVYCHNAFSFYQWKLHDLLFAPKIALFALFTKYIYQTNIQKNKFIVVQQLWFRKAMAKSFSISEKQIIVAPPTIGLETKLVSQPPHSQRQPHSPYTFIYPASPNSHKNFEVICRAVALLCKKEVRNFKVLLTLSGSENSYAKWLYRQWAHVKEIEFGGYLSKQELVEKYQQSQAMIFPSKVETWGLPISEFAPTNKPLLLADLPYAYETAAGAQRVAYFHPDQPQVLAEMMEGLISGQDSFLAKENKISIPEPLAIGWDGIFSHLLK